LRYDYESCPRELIFDEWVHNAVGEIFVQLFDTTLANWVGAPSGICTMSKYCGHAATIEHNGDVYSCDHFVFPEYRLGNIHDTPIINIMYSHQQRTFGRAKYTTLPGQCKRCKFLFACYGECPRNRFLTTADGEKGLNYLYEETLTGFGKRKNPVSTSFPNGEGEHNFDGFDNIYVSYTVEQMTFGDYSIR
jgi:radical SAM protein with 4Fe4S-binding SPASM domain